MDKNNEAYNIYLSIIKDISKRCFMTERWLWYIDHNSVLTKYKNEEEFETPYQLYKLINKDGYGNRK